jgi:hypothetical protein
MGFSKKKYNLMLTRNYLGQYFQVSEEPLLCKLFDKVFELENICRTATLMDLHSYKVYTDTGRVKKALLRRDRRPFMFVIYNN